MEERLDIWRWVTEAQRTLRAEGQGRLADLIEALPGAVCDNEHARVDAMYPEALALAKATGNPWLEVFVRHWNLQSRILHRHEVADWMGEAVSLVELASRPEAKGCPQSVCVTQDLVNCYGNRDGPGYAAERIAASEEALARIDARWPCYRCIGGELVEALVDAGEPKKALARLDALETDIQRVEGRLDPHPMGESRVAVLRELGRPAEALALVERLDDEDEGDDDSRLERQIEHAWVLSLLGRDDEAERVLPPRIAVQGTHSLYPGWAAVTTRLATAGVVDNDWALDRTFATLGDELAAIGASRHAVELELDRGRLALARGRRSTAEACLARVELLIPRLRAPLGAVDARDALAAAIEAAPAADAKLGDSPAATLSTLGRDPELDLETLDAARAKWPEHAGLARQRAEALLATGQLEAAEGALRALSADPEARLRLAQVLSARGARDEARAIADALIADGSEAVAEDAHALLVELARARGDRGEALRLLRAAVGRSPDDPAPAMALADALHESGETAEALAVLDALAAQAEPGPWDVWRVIYGTLIDAWASVEVAAERLGLAMPARQIGGEVVRLALTEDDGALSMLWARRTGLATARVLTMSGPDEVQHYRDLVVFDPRTLDEDDDDPGFDDDEDDRPLTYRAVAVKRPGEVLVVGVDGLHPGDEAIDALRAAVDAIGGEVRLMSGPGYRLIAPDGEPDAGERCSGVYLYAAVDAGQARALDAVLTRETAGWRAAVWPTLVDAIGDRARLLRHHRVMNAWGM